MLQLIALVLALAIVYAVKAYSISRQHDELALDSTAFSWMRPRDYREIVESAQVSEEEIAAALEPQGVATVPRTLVHA